MRQVFLIGTGFSGATYCVRAEHPHRIAEEANV